jgi:hypothetical protein
MAQNDPCNPYVSKSGGGNGARGRSLRPTAPSIDPVAGPPPGNVGGGCQPNQPPTLCTPSAGTVPMTNVPGWSALPPTASSIVSYGMGAIEAQPVPK